MLLAAPWDEVEGVELLLIPSPPTPCPQLRPRASGCSWLRWLGWGSWTSLSRPHHLELLPVISFTLGNSRLSELRLPQGQPWFVVIALAMRGRTLLINYGTELSVVPGGQFLFQAVQTGTRTQTCWVHSLFSVSTAASPAHSITIFFFLLECFSPLKIRCNTTMKPSWMSFTYEHTHRTAT